MLLKLSGICKSYGRQAVLEHIGFSVDRGDLVSIIGPSGVGKTTLLAIIAGLEKPDSGSIEFTVPPSIRQPVIMVFQDYTLFPNMTVFENIAFGLKARRIPKSDTARRVTRLLDYFQLTPQKNSYPVELSAGQKQRTAIARAMVVEPSLLLLDEPFANLDRNLKMDTASFIRSTLKEFGTTALSVTHDLKEAFAMSDKIGILLDNRLQQFASPADIYNHPSNIKVASFMGPVNRISPDLLPLLGVRDAGAARAGAVFARPEAFLIARDEKGPAQVMDVTFIGHYIMYRVMLKGSELTVYSLSGGIGAGDRVRIELLRHFKP